MISIVTTAKPVGAAASACRHRFTMTTRASQAARDAGGCTNPTTVTQPPQSRQSIHLEQGFGATRLNTGTMTDLATLAATLLANFRTVHIPSSKRWPRAVRRLVGDGKGAACRQSGCIRLPRPAPPRTGASMATTVPRPDGTRPERVDGGSTFSSPIMLLCRLLDELTEGECGPGDPVSFNPEGIRISSVYGI